MNDRNNRTGFSTCLVWHCLESVLKALILQKGKLDKPKAVSLQ